MLSARHSRQLACIHSRPDKHIRRADVQAVSKVDADEIARILEPVRPPHILAFSSIPLPTHQYLFVLLIDCSFTMISHFLLPAMLTPAC